MMRRCFALVLLALVLSGGAAHALPERSATPDPTDLRAESEATLQRLVAALPATDRQRLTGIYLVVEEDAAEPAAQVACDDDGDDVIVVSEALLRLAWNVAWLASYDDVVDNGRPAAYATFLARSQLPGRKLLPPPPGVFVAARPAAPTRGERFREIVAFLLARELVHFRAGDLVCPHPTAAREPGDDEWTGSERRRAEGIAAMVYPGRNLERDQEAATRVLEAGVTLRGALGWLGFFTQFEADRSVALGRFRPRYLELHPASAARRAAVAGVDASRPRGSGG